MEALYQLSQGPEVTADVDLAAFAVRTEKPGSTRFVPPLRSGGPQGRTLLTEMLDDARPRERSGLLESGGRRGCRRRVRWSKRAGTMRSNWKMTASISR